MKSDEIERLLGGYATNTLTDGERKMLYEAALDDQELFNALEDEDALRDLLADSESRREIEAALRRPPPRQPGKSWFARPWTWGLAGSVAAACALVFVLTRPNEPPKPGVQVAIAPQASASAPVPEVSQPLVGAKGKPARQAPRHAPTEQVFANLQADKVESRPPSAEAPQPASVSTGALSERAFSAKILAVRAGLPIKVLRAETPVKAADPIEAGDRIQFRLRVPYSGMLTLVQDGVSGTPLTVTSGQEYTIPDAPIAVDKPSSFRLMLSGADGMVQNAALTIIPGKPIAFQ